MGEDYQIVSLTSDRNEQERKMADLEKSQLNLKSSDFNEIEWIKMDKWIKYHTSRPKWLGRHWTLQVGANAVHHALAQTPCPSHWLVAGPMPKWLGWLSQTNIP